MCTATTRLWQILKRVLFVLLLLDFQKQLLYRTFTRLSDFKITVQLLKDFEMTFYMYY